ncbi:MAG: tetratricopeptide repeat protein [Anaerolineae bacterium]|nr:tetratricopeptide repeat protein [Anaerolineae bacterium]
MERDQLPVDSLTGREREILRLIALGLSNRGIAEELVVALETVNWYTKQIYSKLGVSGRMQAVNRAKELGLLQAERPAQAPIAPPPAFLQRHNLPASASPLVGRVHAIAEVKHLVQTMRLVTLTGVGGTGKTRLALQVAQDVMADFADGVFFVDLAPLSESELVAQAVAAVLGIFEIPPESLLQTLKRALAGRDMLLVLDNFEHVIAAASVVSELLAAAARLKVLATSREALRLSGEQEYAVPPLSLPPAKAVSIESVTASEAGALFVKRVQMMLPRFEVTDDTVETIARICARLDGLPLAIELAAAYCKLLSPQALLDRLDSRLDALVSGARDAPARQKTLRTAIEWSYNLLEPAEKVLFARLAVFRGGRSLEAIEAVCQPDLPVDVFDGLAALVDKSLIQQQEAPGGEPRFVMLETIHEYARERLAESGARDTIRRRYAEYFVALAERAEPNLRLGEHGRWAQRLELEIHNLRAVLDWSLNGGDVVYGVRLLGALHLFWWAYGYHVEGNYWTQPLLERLDEAPVTHHAKFLFSGGLMAIMQHDLDKAKRLLMASLSVSQTLDDKQFTGWALIYLGFAMLSESEEALAAAEEGLALFRELDHKPGIAQALNIVGNVAARLKDYDRAQRSYDECLTVARQTGETRQICHVFHNRALLGLLKGDYERAMHEARQALDLAIAMNNELLIILGMTILAAPIGWKGQPRRAARLLGASEALLEAMGAFYQPIDQPEIERIIAGVQAQLDAVTFRSSWAEGRTLSLEQAVAEALSEVS